MFDDWYWLVWFVISVMRLVVYVICMHWLLLDDSMDIWLWYELSVGNDNVDYLLCCELSIYVYLDNELNCFKLKTTWTLKDTLWISMRPGSGFHIWGPKTTSISNNVRSWIQMVRVKTRGVRAIRQYNSVGDSVMSLTE
jgi:hypothetical protein